MQQRKWVCPTLCGCELNITAEWNTDPKIENGVSFHHDNPKEDSIKDIEIINVCATHQPFLTEPLPTDIYEYNGDLWTGYLKITTQQYVQHMKDRGRPLDPAILLDPALATPAQKVFIRLYPETKCGTLKVDTCTCKLYAVCHRYITDQVEYKENPHQTFHCKFHQNDIDHVECLKEVKLKNDTITQLGIDHPELMVETFDDQGSSTGSKFKEAEMTWKYNDQRELEINLPTLSSKDKSDFNNKTPANVKIK